MVVAKVVSPSESTVKVVVWFGGSIYAEYLDYGQYFVNCDCSIIKFGGKSDAHVYDSISVWSRVWLEKLWTLFSLSIDVKGDSKHLSPPVCPVSQIGFASEVLPKAVIQFPEIGTMPSLWSTRCDSTAISLRTTQVRMYQADFIMIIWIRHSYVSVSETAHVLGTTYLVRMPKL